MMSDKHPFLGRTFKANESVPVTGTYILLGEAYTNTDTRVDLKQGIRFPKRSDNSGTSYHYALLKLAE